MQSIDNARLRELERVFRDHYAEMFRRVNVRIGRQAPADIEDALSTCFLRALQPGERHLEGTHLINTLVLCACHRLLDRIKHQGYEVNPGHGDAAITDADDPMHQLIEPKTPISELGAKRFRECVERCLSGYRFASREIETAVRLNIFAELPDAEIAALIGRTNTATRQMLSTQMRRLRAALAPCKEHLLA